MATWRIRATMDEIDIGRRYAGHPRIFSIQLHHGGKFTQLPERKYINGNRHYVDLLDIDTFSIHDIDEMMTEFVYISEDVTKLYYNFQIPFNDLDYGLFALCSDQDVRHLAMYVGKHKLIDIYTEHGKTNLHTYLMSPSQYNVRIDEIEPPNVINGRSMWEKSPCLITLLPPKHRATIGRPKKKRKKSAMEKEDLVRGNTVSRAYRSVTCTKCNNIGHNARTCKGQRPTAGGGKAKGKGKTQV